MTNHVDFNEISLKDYKSVYIETEGGGEKAIIDILRENGNFAIEETQIMPGGYLRRKSREETESIVASHGGEKKNLLLRISDSFAPYTASRLYKKRYDICTIVTNPEIEILIIYAEDLENNNIYLKSTKPSSYLNTKWKKGKEYKKRHKNLKAESFFKEYFANPNVLVNAINRYSKNKKDKYNNLSDILKK